MLYLQNSLKSGLTRLPSFAGFLSPSCMFSVLSRSADSGIDQTIIIFSRAIDHPFIPLGMPIGHWKRMPLSFQLTVCAVSGCEP